MMKKPICDKCKAFSAMTRECRRHAPVMVPMSQPEGHLAATGLSPATKADNWCEEYLPDESVIQ
jgi:hypothetical protein